MGATFGEGAGERTRRKTLNCRSSSPSRLLSDVRRTGLPREGSKRFLREREAGERWKKSSEASSDVSTIAGILLSARSKRTYGKRRRTNRTEEYEVKKEKR